MPSEERPRIVLLVTLSGVGGAQTYVAALVPALVERFDVVVAAHGDGPLRAAVQAAGARYVPLRHVRRALGPRDVLGLLELVALLRRERPAVLHANSSKAGILGRVAAALTGVPVSVFTAHGWAFGARDGLSSTLYRWADRLARPSDHRDRLRVGERAPCRPGRAHVRSGAHMGHPQRRRDRRGRAGRACAGHPR